MPDDILRRMVAGAMTGLRELRSVVGRKGRTVGTVTCIAAIARNGHEPPPGDIWYVRTSVTPGAVDIGCGTIYVTFLTRDIGRALRSVLDRQYTEAMG